MGGQVKLFIVDFDDFDTDDLAIRLQKFGIEIDSSSRTYKQKLFSQFIRHEVLMVFLKLLKIKFSVNKNNKPYLESHSHTYFNISHTKNQIVMAVADKEIGVDVEEIVSKKNNMAIARRYFGDCEIKNLEQSADLQKDFYTLWTLKESQVKQNSLGIAYGLKDALFFRKNNRWISESFETDFLTYFYNNNAVISLCYAGIYDSPPIIYKIKGDCCFEQIDLRCS